jgi:hypothetical protein
MPSTNTIAEYKHLKITDVKSFIKIGPDHQFWLHAAETYSRQNSHMYSGKKVCGEDTYKNGITNGAQWYVQNTTLYNFLLRPKFKVFVRIS